EKSPNDRFQSAEEVSKELDTTVTKELFEVSPNSGSLSGETIKPKGVVDKRQPAPKPGAPGIPVLPLVIAAGVALVIVVVIVVVVLVLTSGPDKAVLRSEACTKAETLLKGDKLDEAEAELKAVIAKA